MSGSVRERVQAIARRLRIAGIGSAALDAWLLLAAATGRSRAELVAGAVDRLTPEQEQRLEALVARRLAREPMAYILGEKEFWSLAFAVAPGVLIPRPETETLVEAALTLVADRAAPLRILDLGTGSGCLLIALLTELPNATGLGIDVSEQALAVADANAGRLGVAARARFARGDWARDVAGRFELIVANPPYVGDTDWAGLQPEIRDHEPAAALRAGPDGLDAYGALAPDCARLLAPGGHLVLEIGAGQGDSVARLLAAHGLRVVDRRADLAGIERCAIARRA